MKCEECGVNFSCVSISNGLCKECDEQFNYCYDKCKNPCRKKEEQERYFDKWKSDWRECNT